jgi:Holliday junction resolvase RusA-like endonuclease
LTESIRFEVSVASFEPLSLRGKKRRRLAKKEMLRNQIEEKIGMSELEKFKEEFKDRRVKVTLVFHLWDGPSSITNTRSKKDIDNLAKPVLDVLQQHLDAEGTKPGLGLIKNDDDVYVQHASKRLVAKREKEGLQIIVSKIRESGTA